MSSARGQGAEASDGRVEAAANGRLAGKVAVITGTGGGQGRAAALFFAREGAIVVGGDLKSEGARETVELVRAAGGTMTSTDPIDFTDRDAVAVWIQGAVDEYGGLDIVYNNASCPQRGGIGMSIEDWHLTMTNEVDLVFYVTQAAWPHLVAQGGGAVINVSSTQGINAIRQGASGLAHAAAKHAVIGLTRELAAEGGPHGIRVNVLSPGLIDTPATARLRDIPGYDDAFVRAQIIERLGQPEDIASAAVFLASDEASFVTGQNLIIDGGFTIV